MIETLLVLLGVALLTPSLFLVWKNIEICAPNEVLIFSAPHRQVNGRVRSAIALVQGGRGFRWPLIEMVDRMDLTNMVIDLRVAERLLQGRHPAQRADGGQRQDRQPRAAPIGNAIERLLGKSRAGHAPWRARPWKATCAGCWPR